MVYLPDRQKERVGARELADRFEVSPRTIYRDIDAINRAGIPVFSTPGSAGHNCAIFSPDNTNIKTQGR